MEGIVLVEYRTGLGDEVLSHITTALGRHRSIKEAVVWLAAHDPPIAPAGMVTQDEYSHDIIVPYPGGLWLVYDST
jgi:hypothetical protein